jgi:pimeloyl-ACP methyl ester carboxylesterase
MLAPAIPKLPQMLSNVSFETKYCAGIEYLHAGAAIEHNSALTETVVLLHGIGSGATSWTKQLQAMSQHQNEQQENSLSTDQRVLAWNAPGYGGSASIGFSWPLASDYASVLWTWLDTLKVSNSHSPGRLHLVGHSLGALIAASATLMRPTQVSRLTLLAPAQGYLQETEEVRDRVLNQRLATLDQLGPHGLAAARAPSMLSADAASSDIAFVQNVMAGLNPDGYRSAAQMLALGDLLSDLRFIKEISPDLDIQVASGLQDVITPPAKCIKVAAVISKKLIDLGGVGHLCAFEASAAVNQLIGLEFNFNQGAST